MEMHSTLTRIRKQHSSKLENQKMISGLLVAVEESILSINLNSAPQTTSTQDSISPLAYFGTLMTLLASQPSIAEPALYLLALILPHLPTAVLRLKCLDVHTVFAKILLEDESADNVPLLKGLVGCYETLLVAQDAKQWASLPMMVFSWLISVGLDPRPKLRKIALDACKKILRSTPPPTLYHPASTIVLAIFIQRVPNLFQEKDNARDVHFLQTVLFLLPELTSGNVNDSCKEKLMILSKSLVQLPPTLLSTTSSTAVDLLFQTITLLFTPLLFTPTDVKLCLDSIYAMRPAENDTRSGEWVGVVCRTTLNLITVSEQSNDTTKDILTKPVLKVFKKCLFFYAGSGNVALIAAVFGHLSAFVGDALTHSRLASLTSESTLLSDLAEMLTRSLPDIKYQKAWPHILALFAATLAALSNASLPHSFAIMASVMEIRDDPLFEAYEAKREIDMCITSGIAGVGVQTFLATYSMNVYTEGIKRVFLAPLIKKALDLSSTKVHSLAYLTSDIIPLIKRVLQDAQSNKGMTGKIWETLAGQLLEIVPAYCRSGLGDLKEGLRGFCKVALNGIRSEEGMRGVLCAGVGEIVDGVWNTYQTQRAQSELGKQTSQDSVLQEVNMLKTFSTKFLAVLCQNYAHFDALVEVAAEVKDAMQVDEAPKESQKDIKAKEVALKAAHDKLNVHTESAIRSFLNLANPDSVNNYFMMLIKSTLKLQLDQTDVKHTTSITNLKIYAGLELLVMLLPHISSVRDIANGVAGQSDSVMQDGSPLRVYYTLLEGHLESSDATLQKRTYKSLNKLISALIDANTDSSDVLTPVYLSTLLTLLQATLLSADILAQTLQPAKKSRVELIGRVIALTPLSEMMAFIPVCMPEVILCTKEASEKARMCGFEVLMVCARRLKNETNEADDAHMTRDGEDVQMTKGEDVQMTKEEDMQEDDESFEYPPLTFSSLLMMLLAGLAGSTANMQSAAISCLAKILHEFRDMSLSTLKPLIETILLTFASPQKEIVKAGVGFVKVCILVLPLSTLIQFLPSTVSQLRSDSYGRIKIRHVFERLVKRVGYEMVERYMPEDEMKMLQYIRKTQNNKKNKRDAADKLDDSKHTNEDKHDDSDSELDLPDLFEKMQSHTKSSARLRESGTDIVDFLDQQIISQVSDPRRKKQPVQRATEKIAADGRLVFGDSDSDAEGKRKSKREPEDFYKLAMEGEDAFTRLKDGSVKFQKRKRGGEVEQASDSETEQRSKIAAKEDMKVAQMLGRQYKAKKARGDVRKEGAPDPFAYIPLTKAGGKNGKGGKSEVFKQVVSGASGANAGGGKVRKSVPKKGNKKHNK